MGLRTIYWLRQRKMMESGVDIPATSMGAVRAALASLADLEIPLWHGGRPMVLVSGEGHLYLETPGGVQTVKGQKDRAARQWCGNATTLSGAKWKYRRVDQREYEKLAPKYFSDLSALG